MSHSKRVAKNTYYFTIANVLQKMIAFFYFAFISRMIGPDNLGIYTYALSFTSLFGIFVDIGFEKVLIRESAKKLESAQEYFSNILGLKLPLAFLSLIVIFFLAHIQNYPILTKQLIFIAAFVMCIDSFNLSMECVLRGFQNLTYESIAVIICQLITLIIGIGGVILSKDIKILIIALLAGSIFRFIFYLVILIKKYKIYPKIDYNKTILKFLLKTVWPFAVAGLFLKGYSYADAILLYNMAGKTAAGYYSLPYRAVNAFQFIPMAFSAALLPAFSFFYISERHTLKRAFEKATLYLAAISIPISLGTIALAEEIIVKFFGKPFLPSVIALQILMCNLIFLFLDFPAGTLLNACDKEKTNTIVMGIAMALNIASNLLLIPRLGVVGSSISMIISTLFLVISRMYFSYKVAKYDYVHLFAKILRTLVAGMIMYLAVIYTKPFVNLYISVLIGALIYSISLFSLRGIEKSDVIFFYESLRHKM